MAQETIRVGDLTAVIGDNEAAGPHRAGYNGIHRLTHRTEAETLLVPSFAGLNFEHIFDGDQGLHGAGSDDQIFFEPRRAPMTLRRVSEDEAELHQGPTPTFFLESWTRFKLVAPDAIDFTFRCKPHQHAFRHGYIGLFWASYINAPEDKSIYFRGGNLWQQYCTQAHDLNSTVRHKDDGFEPPFSPETRNTLFKSFSPLRYDEPFFYGLFRKHLVALMFDRSSGIRFSHSPSGGGVHPALETNNPAWDFQFLIPKYEVLQEYGFRARLIYRERCSREQILRDFQAWRASLDRR